MTGNSASIETLDFDADNGPGARARIHLLSDDDIAIHRARIPNAMEVTPDTLRQMETDLQTTF